MYTKITLNINVLFVLRYLCNLKGHSHFLISMSSHFLISVSSHFRYVLYTCHFFFAYHRHKYNLLSLQESNLPITMSNHNLIASMHTRWIICSRITNFRLFVNYFSTSIWTSLSLISIYIISSNTTSRISIECTITKTNNNRRQFKFKIETTQILIFKHNVR